jgi:iron complex transport system ATP-binding protein
MADSVLRLTDVSVVRDGNPVLKSIDWTVEPDERWVILGRNGAGKTTLLQIAAAALHPTSGEAVVLGESVGHTDLSELRPLLGFASSALARRIPRNERVLDVVMTAAYAVTGRWNELYEEIDERRAHRVLAEWHLDHLADRTFGSLSDGEQKRVQIARSVMTDPEILLLDEPAASLDLGGREELLQLLGGYASDPKSPAIVMVTHHVEEIPQAFNRALLLKDGEITAQGPIGEVITSENLSATFDVEVEIAESDGRFTARARQGIVTESTD